MNLTLKELINIHTQLDGSCKPSIACIVVHNLLLFNNIQTGKLYLERIFKEELLNVMDVNEEMDSWCDLLKLLLKHSIRKLENVPKPKLYRIYIAYLTQIEITDYLKHLNKKTKSDEWLSIGEVSIALDRCEKMVRNYIKNGKLQGTRDKANKIRIPKSSLEAFQRGESLFLEDQFTESYK